LCFGFWVLGFGIWGSGFGVWRLGFWVWVWVLVWVLGFETRDLGIGDWDSRVEVLGLGGLGGSGGLGVGPGAWNFGVSEFGI
jgi:hypothetical protein